jgi:hypothetical protein
VDQKTGTVTLRARFANPQSVLLPGMFVTAEFAQAVDTSAFLVPQQAVTRDPKGNATVFVVGPGNRAVQRTIVNASTGWIVERMGWFDFFLLCTILALPGMVLLLRVAPWRESIDTVPKDGRASTG